MKKSKLKKALATAGVLSVALLSGVGLASCDDGGEPDVSDVDLTITKSEAILSVSSYKDKSNYRDAGKSEIDDIINDAKTKINASTSKESIDLIVSEAKSKLDAVKTAAELDKEESEVAVKASKEAKIASINTLYANYSESDYRTADWANLVKLVNDAKAEINAMNNSATIDAYSIEALKTKLDAIKTDATLTAEELQAAKDAKLKAIDDVAAKYPEENYRTEQKTDRATAISEAKETINGYTVIADVNAYTTTELENKLKALKTDAAYTAEELEAAKTSKKSEIDAVLTTYNENDYSSANWTIITNYISAAKAAVDALTTKNEVTAYDLTALKAKVADVKTAAQELKAAKDAKLAEIATIAAKYPLSNYRTDEKEKINKAINNARDVVNSLLNTIEEVNDFSLDELESELASYKTDSQYKEEESSPFGVAKAAKLQEINELNSKYDRSLYYENEQAQIDQIIIDAIYAVENVATTVEELELISIGDISKSLDVIKTKEVIDEEKKTFETSKANLLNELNDLELLYDVSLYYDEEADKITKLISNAKTAITSLITTLDELNEFSIDDLKLELASLKTKKQIDEEKEISTARQTLLNSLDEIANKYPLDNYKEDEQLTIEKIINDEKIIINSLLTTVDEINNYSLENFENRLKALKTIADYDDLYNEAKESLYTNIDNVRKEFSDELYTADGILELDNIISKIKNDLEQLLTDYASFDLIDEETILKDLRNDLEKVKTKAELDEEESSGLKAKIEEINNSIDELLKDYTEESYYENEWNKILNEVAVEKIYVSILTLEEANAFTTSELKSRLDKVKTKVEVDEEKSLVEESVNAMIVKVDDLAAKYDLTLYDETGKEEINNLIASTKLLINSIESKEDLELVVIDDLLSDLKEELDKVKTIEQISSDFNKAKEEKLQQVETLETKYDKSLYKEDEQKIISEEISTAKLMIDLCETISDLNNININEIDKTLNALKTISDYEKEESKEADFDTLKSNLFAELDNLLLNYDINLYREAQQQELNNIITQAKASIDFLCTTVEDLNMFSIDGIKTELDAVKTDAELTLEGK